MAELIEPNLLRTTFVVFLNRCENKLLISNSPMPFSPHPNSPRF